MEKTPLTGKDPDAGKDRRQKEKGMAEDEIVRKHWENISFSRKIDIILYSKLI